MATQSAFKDTESSPEYSGKHSGTWALGDHLEGTRTLMHLRQAGTRTFRAFRHFGTWTIKALRHLGNQALKTLGHIGTRGTLCRRLRFQKAHAFLGRYKFSLGLTHYVIHSPS